MDATRFIEEDNSLKASTGYNTSRQGEPAGICDVFLIGISYLLVICTMPLSLFFCFKVVQEYERAVIFRLGRLSKGGARGPGLFFILPCTDNYCKCDLRTVSFNVPPQGVLSKDSVTVSVDAVVYYRISNATIAVSNGQLRFVHPTSGRHHAENSARNPKSLSEILSRKRSTSVMSCSIDMELSSGLLNASTGNPPNSVCCIKFIRAKGLFLWIISLASIHIRTTHVSV
ncbi:stomatin-2 [Caerostris extrusa]|uniref:Stomatin-2 n=1 Tax=Caerostris extrusa TaxID=172846 RepID=A0AAV4UNH9_CAEEX|nr:stomatin-2 [Caerostris extrusa]